MTTSNTRRRPPTYKPPKHVAAAPVPRVINAAPSLEKAEMYGVDDDRPVFSRAMALAGRIFIETIPQWLTIGAMLCLIFGGCCSNVFALEAIIKVEPDSGMFLFFEPLSLVFSLVVEVRMPALRPLCCFIANRS